MRRTILAAAFAALSLPAAAQETLSPNPAIQGTIQSQIDALLKDDFATAFSFASPNIKGIFGSPDNFGLMVRQGYPMVWRPSSVRMLELREVAGNLWQRVMVTDQAGATHMLDYMMIETPDGWQINAVQLLPSVGVGA
jgi:lysozyme family protein